MSTYGSTITAIGDTALLEAATAGAGVTLTHMLIGDGGGAFVPTESLSGRTSLVRQVYSLPIMTMYDDPSQPNQKIVEAILPIDVGGFTIRELGLGDANGRLIAAGNFPDTPKTTLAEGCTRDMLLRFVVATSHAAQLTVIINPSVVMASIQDVTLLVAGHEQKSNPHPVYVTHAEHPSLHPWRYFFGQL